MNGTFEAFVLEKKNDQVIAAIRSMKTEDLPDGELLIQVAFSSLNYKDALACTANGNIVKNYPFVPGIDLSGTVVSSTDNRFLEGDQIIVTGYGLGVSHFGGYSRFARVPADWAVKKPSGLSLKEAMTMGTAGFTAALSVAELRENGVRPESGPVLVTGATGGVGSLSVAILAKLGYDVVAGTGKLHMTDELLGLGAGRVVNREQLIPEQNRALDKQQWAGAIDCVGGRILSSLLPSVRYGGVVAACGLTGGHELTATVFPFILRGIRLIGIDSVWTGMSRRVQVWELLASEYKPSMPDTMHRVIALEQVMDEAPLLLQGQARGRIVVEL